jgi:hypothetical protein
VVLEDLFIKYYEYLVLMVVLEQICLAARGLSFSKMAWDLHLYDEKESEEVVGLDLSGREEKEDY